MLLESVLHVRPLVSKTVERYFHHKCVLITLSAAAVAQKVSGHRPATSDQRPATSLSGGARAEEPDDATVSSLAPREVGEHD